MSITTDPQKVDEVLNRGVITDILPERNTFREKLLSGERLKIYIGADPTSPSLHLSHAKNFQLLEDLRQLGHEVVVLIGDFTARIGDPTEESSARKQLSKQEVKENVKTWISQIDPVVDFRAWNNPAKIVYNSKWLSRLKLEDILDISSHFTVQHMLERDMFEKRLKKENPIYMHEFFYPLMQGYDSVFLEVDAELCGTDQTFNALAGRTLLKRMKNKEKFVITTSLMENPTTGELMSKSKGTGVFLDTSAEDMYGSIMAQPDEMVEVLLVNNTRLPLSDVRSIVQKENKRDAKKQTAFEIVKIFHGEKEAEKAQDYFTNTFQKKEVPEEIPDVHLKSNMTLADALMESGIVESKNEFKRLQRQRAIKNTETGNAVAESDTFNVPTTIKIGKRRFVKIIPN